MSTTRHGLALSDIDHDGCRSQRHTWHSACRSTSPYAAISRSSAYRHPAAWQRTGSGYQAARRGSAPAARQHSTTIDQDICTSIGSKAPVASDRALHRHLLHNDVRTHDEGICHQWTGRGLRPRGHRHRRTDRRRSAGQDQGEWALPLGPVRAGRRDRGPLPPPCSAGPRTGRRGHRSGTGGDRLRRWRPRRRFAHPVVRHLRTLPDRPLRDLHEPGCDSSRPGPAPAPVARGHSAQSDLRPGLIRTADARPPESAGRHRP